MDNKTVSGLSETIFKNPPAQFRAVPFWAWNCRLDIEELKRQIEVFRKMGMGGFMIHARNGLDTPYMKDEFMSYVNECIEKGKEEDMFTWLYDEDRWPSGDAGHQVTKNPKYKCRVVKITTVQEPVLSKDQAYVSGNSYLLGMYAISRNTEGELIYYRKLTCENDCAASEQLFYAYCQCVPGSHYVDTLSKEAIDCFINLTHEKYKAYCGQEFGSSVYSIFTDEPQFTKKEWLISALDNGPVCLPWTVDFPDTFIQETGVDILDYLPELFWDKENGAFSQIRYLYHNHLTDRFTEAFSDNIGKWCSDNNILLSGHMMAEQALWTQSAWTGESMRAYRAFQIPGIDMLCDFREYTTVLQARSAVHQYGARGLLSEMYGVTNWDFDFRGHKLQGDWQAALGVTIRVPHLSWVSMSGDANRDYPASINYQSPWYLKYKLVEDHFARVNAAMTRGKPVVDVAVIHPIETAWLYWGPESGNKERQLGLENIFRKMTDWLLFNNIDFDFLSEDSMPKLYKESTQGLSIGEMNYKMVIISGCETLRKSTVLLLTEFARKGGDVLFVGKIPTLVDASKQEADLISGLASLSRHIDIDKKQLEEATVSLAQVRILDENRMQQNQYLYNLRQEKECKWLFIANGRKPDKVQDTVGKSIKIQIKGAFNVQLYDTQQGTISAIACTHLHDNDSVWTEVSATLYTHDSLLLRLKDTDDIADIRLTMEKQKEPARVLCVDESVSYITSEQNVLLLDMAEFSCDDEPWHEAEELLRIDSFIHKKYWKDRPLRQSLQPYMIDDEPYEHTLHLKLRFNSDIILDDCKLALEDVSNISIFLNNSPVAPIVSGYYTDKAIQTVALPTIHAGENILELHIPIRYKSCIEWCYILGDFDVRIDGGNKSLVTKSNTIRFQSITNQGLPFYGANITYKTEIDIPGDTDELVDLQIKVPEYRGAMVSVNIDGKTVGNIIYAPYSIDVKNMLTGKHTIDFTCYGNRYNSFGPLHMHDEKCIWFGPACWRTQGDKWTYEYELKDMGIVKPPEISFSYKY